MNSFSSANRAAIIQQLAGMRFDVLVIGGGITGAGIALDATARGLKVALIDMQDFAGGTSGRSTKLIHGGLRYLKQLEFRLVAEVGKEREIIHRIAPHLTKPEHMLLPIVKGGSLGKWSSQLGMLIYERLAGVKKEEKHKVLNVAETLALEPSLRKDNLEGGILFYEYRTDDARLTIEVLKEAVSRGAAAVNYSKATGFIYDRKKVSGVKATDQLNDTSFEIRADYIVNASGPWVEELDALDQKQNDFKLRITKGVHLVVDGKKLPVRQSLYFDTFDKRMLFVIPREGKTYIGTTDTFYNGDKLRPEITYDDKNYILKCVNACFPGHQLSGSDIESCWAGLRPLINKAGKSPSEISRKDELFVFPSGLITIAGGKLTGYRKMAQRVVDVIAAKMKANGRSIPACGTDTLKLSGGKINDPDFNQFVKRKLTEASASGTTEAEALSIINRYGSNCDMVFDGLKTPVPSEAVGMPPLLQAQLVYALENELCAAPSDFFIRRTGMLYFDIENMKAWQEPVIAFMKSRLDWDEHLTSRFRSELRQTISGMRLG